MLAYYSWETDEQALVPKAELGATLNKLARACPSDQPEAAQRLQLKALALAADDDKRIDQPAAQRLRLRPCWRSPRRCAPSTTSSPAPADDLVGYATAAEARAARATGHAVRRGARPPDARSDAVQRRAHLGRDREGPAARASTTTRRSSRRRCRHRFARWSRAPIARPPTRTNARPSSPAPGYVLAVAGLVDESDQLYQAELKRSHSPYYYMLGLASNARRRGDKAAAIDWARQAYETAQGPATRLQWGTSYVGYLVEFAPEDAARIEKTAQAVIAEVAADDVFFGRNRAALTRISTRLGQVERRRQARRRARPAARAGDAGVRALAAGRRRPQGLRRAVRARRGQGVKPPHARRYYSAPLDAREAREFVPFMHELIGAAIAVIRPLFLSGVAVDTKHDTSPVTAADRGAEQAMRALIEHRYPAHGVVGEEFGERAAADAKRRAIAGCSIRSTARAPSSPTAFSSARSSHSSATTAAATARCWARSRIRLRGSP